MKAVLGFLFVFAGLTVGYLVLAGKLPNSGITSTGSPSTGQSAGAPTSTQINSRYRNQGSILGFPTTISTGDMPPSRGGLS